MTHWSCGHTHTCTTYVMFEGIHICDELTTGLLVRDYDEHISVDI